MTKTRDQATKTSDSLNDLLNHIARDTELHFESGLCGAWTLAMTNPQHVGFHLVTRGHCWFGLSEDQQELTAQRLDEGAAIFVNRGVSHFLSHTRVPLELSQNQLKQLCEPAHINSGMVCYDVLAEGQAIDLFFQLLPRYVIFTSAQQTDTLKSIIQLIRTEAQLGQPGAKAAIQRLSDVFTLHLLRQMLGSNQLLNGPFAALHDKHLSAVLAALIEHPEHNWSVPDMASRAFLSESAFAERCYRITGLTPKKLLDQVRLHIATTLLQQPNLQLDAIATKLGYQSSTAFSRFFKKYMGVTPSSFRQHN
ncbi:AraC family transcriptional regulator [Pseudidiomarina gelatinasegens]|uniref:AraC family transcriptional regulator n=1 Tax=Pseudidiomarina gelatinasegens TaxID=2487740 RepID=UPI003A98136B